MTRTPLDPRRPNVTRKVVHEGHTFHVTIGFDPTTGLALEVFGSSAKATSDIGYLISDACVAVSLALQHGVSPGHLAKSMATVPVVGEADRIERPASVMGAIVAAIITEEAELLASLGGGA